MTVWDDLTNATSAAVARGGQLEQQLAARDATITDLTEKLAAATTPTPAPVPSPVVSSVRDRLGWSGEALAFDGWHDGTNVQDIAKATGVRGNFVTLWSSGSPDAVAAMVANFATLSKPGGKLAGLTPEFTLPLPGDGPSIDAVADKFADACVTAGLTKPIERIGHEFTIPTIGPQGITNTPGSMADYAARYRRMALRIKAKVPGAEFDWNGYSCGFDPSPAYPGDDIITYVGCDLYDDYQGPGSTKTSATDAYAGYVDPEAAWNGLFFGDPTGKSTRPGSPAWWVAFAKAHGKKVAIPECGVMARLAFPTGGGGDNPRFMRGVFDLLRTGAVHHLCFFVAHAMFRGQLQDHAIDDGMFPKVLAELKKQAAA